MGGFNNDTVNCKNWDFRGTVPVQPQVTSSGQLPIGTGGVPAILVGKLVSYDGSIAIGYNSPDITLSVAASDDTVKDVILQTGTSPIVPSAGAITFNGAVVAAGTHPVRTDGTGPSTMALEVQTSQALAAADATKIGLCNFNSSHFSVDSTGFVSLSPKTGLVLISSQIASASASIVFNNLTSTYANCLLVIEGTNPTTNTDSLQLLVSTDNGSTYASASYAAGVIFNPYNSSTTTNVSSTAFIPLSGPQANSGNACCASIFLNSLGISTYFSCEGNIIYNDSTLSTQAIGRMGGNNSASSVNAIKIQFSSGTIASGVYSLYGFVTS